MTPDPFPADSITPQEWAWVQDLIQEVQREARCEVFGKRLWEWDLAVRLFRKVEYRRIILGNPTENDWLHHAACLHALLAQGHVLRLESQELSDADLNALGRTREQIAAGVAELEQSLREWRHGFSERELAEARRKLFGVAA